MLINNIVPLSIVDGPGNRLVIFLQECNLNCIYCHNFETINRCNNCGACVEGCPTKSLSLENGKVLYDETTCIQCDKCVYTCPYDATPKAKEYSVERVAKMIINYKDFIDGITFSGGECTLQAQEIIEVAKLLKPYNINILIDSNGTFNFEKNQELIDIVDGFMLDVKAINNVKKLTDVDYDVKVLIDKLLQVNKLAELRTVDLDDEESKITIDYIDQIISKNPSVRKKINKLSTVNLKQSQKDRLKAYLLANKKSEV